MIAKVITYSADTDQDSVLNKLLNDGWELKFVTTNVKSGRDNLYFFKDTNIEEKEIKLIPGEKKKNSTTTSTLT